MCQAVWGPAPALLRPLGRDEAEVPEEVTEVDTTIRTVKGRAVPDGMERMRSLRGAVMGAGSAVLGRYVLA